MGFWDFWEDLADSWRGGVSGTASKSVKATTVDGSTRELTDAEKVARRHLFYIGAGLLAFIAAPAVYLAYKQTTAKGKKKKRGLTERERMLGISLENVSQQATGVIITSLASPVIATAAAYIIIQKLEDGAFMTKSLGNAAQTLLTVGAAGPMIQGIGGIATSAFKKGK